MLAQCKNITGKLYIFIKMLNYKTFLVPQALGIYSNIIKHKSEHFYIVMLVKKIAM